MMLVSYIGAGSPAFAPPDGRPKFPHTALYFSRLTHINFIKHSLPLAFLGSANGSGGQRLERSAY